MYLRRCIRSNGSKRTGFRELVENAQRKHASSASQTVSGVSCMHSLSLTLVIAAAEAVAGESQSREGAGTGTATSPTKVTAHS
jgi:hypothetical protein